MCGRFAFRALNSNAQPVVGSGNELPLAHDDHGRVKRFVTRCTYAGDIYSKQIMFVFNIGCRACIVMEFLKRAR